ncbi:MAG: ABC transporter permease [candidate division WOR-3 bacterium]|uniref:ABC transporter permease n=2 Tax=candidate division WOR-3 bacterium TaxID=2052148 RepID=A0A7C3IID0_UNCW3|nr:ABC transporter permease [candidate division WOR-3 bacterium]
MRMLVASAEFVWLLLRSFGAGAEWRRILPRLSEQIYYHGVQATPIVVFASIFVGLTTVVQTGYQLQGMVPNYFVGMGVGRMLLIELGPVFAAFIVASRSASAMAAELGSMQISEQIDALRTMAIDPYHYLCLPRILATTCSLPVLVALMEVGASFTAIVAAGVLGISQEAFIYGITHFVNVHDFVGGLLKAGLFGLLIGTSGCFFGFRVQGGAQDLGRATTNAVVTAAVLILISDFVMAAMLFSR